MAEPPRRRTRTPTAATRWPSSSRRDVRVRGTQRRRRPGSAARRPAHVQLRRRRSRGRRITADEPVLGQQRERNVGRLHDRGRWQCDHNGHSPLTPAQRPGRRTSAEPDGDATVLSMSILVDEQGTSTIDNVTLNGGRSADRRGPRRSPRGVGPFTPTARPRVCAVGAIAVSVGRVRRPTLARSGG